MHPDYLEKILNAQVYDVAVETPLDLAPNLSARIGNPLLIKREDMQPVFSFKLRGAYNKIARLSPEKLKRGVICASAGNHAQGVALSAAKIGCRAVIVMPTTTPQIKIDAVQSRGGEVVLAGESYDEAYARALDALDRGVARAGAAFGEVVEHGNDTPRIDAAGYTYNKTSDKLTTVLGTGAMTADTILDEQKLQLALAKLEGRENADVLRAELTIRAAALREKLTAAEHDHLGTRRLLRAFPDMKSLNYADTLAATRTAMLRLRELAAAAKDAARETAANAKEKIKKA